METPSPFALRREAFRVAMLDLSPAHVDCPLGACICPGEAFHEGMRRAWLAVPANF